MPAARHARGRRVEYFYYVAIQKTDVATAIILQYTAPVWVLLYVVMRGQQKLSLQKVAAVTLAITGIILAIGIVAKVRAQRRPYD